MTRRRTAIALLLIGTVALATRLGAAVAYRSSFPSGDELYYLYGAHSLARSGEIYYGKPVLGGTHWPPGQSVFLWSFVREDRLGDLRPVSAEDAYVVARFRESRDEQGKLTFLPRDQCLAAIADLPLVDVEHARDIRVADLIST